MEDKKTHHETKHDSVTVDSLGGLLYAANINSNKVSAFSVGKMEP